MNYIELINRFWALNKEHSFTSYETQVYFKLLDTCNSLGWKNPFNQSNAYICGEICVSEPKLISVRNKLKQVGLIDFVSGKVKREKTVYTILGLTLFSLNGSQSSSLNGSQSSSLNGTECLDNTKHKQDKTKHVLLKKEPKESERPETAFNFKNSFLELGANEKLLSDWLKVRKTKKATNSETAFKLFKSEFEKTNLSIDDVLSICISKDWKGFKSEWLKNINHGNQQQTYSGKSAYSFDLNRAIETASTGGIK